MRRGRTCGIPGSVSVQYTFDLGVNFSSVLIQVCKMGILLIFYFSFFAVTVKCRGDKKKKKGDSNNLYGSL